MWVAPDRRIWLAELMALAGVTDVLDGYMARSMPMSQGQRERQQHLGEWLDPACDKVFAVSTALAILVTRAPEPRVVVLAFTREWLQLLLMGIRLVIPPLRRSVPLVYRARHLGKATTVAQFVTLFAIAFDVGPAALFSAIAAGLGAGAVLDYAMVAWRARNPRLDELVSRVRIARGRANVRAERHHRPSHGEHGNG